MILSLCGIRLPVVYFHDSVMLLLHHTGVSSDDVSDGCSADGALQMLRLQLQSTGHADTHVTTAIHHRINDTIRADDTVTSFDHSTSIRLSACSASKSRLLPCEIKLTYITYWQYCGTS